MSQPHPSIRPSKMRATTSVAFFFLIPLIAASGFVHQSLVLTRQSFGEVTDSLVHTKNRKTHHQKLRVSVRGGAVGNDIVSRITRSKSACWAVLLTSILIETFSSALSKKARDTASALRFVIAVGLYICRYVALHL